MWIRKATRHFSTLLITALVGGLAGATLMRLAPGFGADERELDSRLSAETVQTIRDSHAGERNVIKFYGRYLAGLATGNLGESRSLQRPVTELFRERIPVTFRALGFGLLAGWALGLTAAAAAVLSRRPAIDAASSFLSGIFLCLPSAVLALAFLFAGGGVSLAIALVLFPKVFRYTRNLMVEAYGRQHVLAARARGIGETRVLFWHVAPAIAPQLAALVGISASLGFGASIPIEVICDSPGIGQLAWRAAMGRDLPLLVNVTLLVTLVTLVANAFSDVLVTASVEHSK